MPCPFRPCPRGAVASLVSIPVRAKDTFSQIKMLAEKHDEEDRPYKILEIVPDKTGEFKPVGAEKEIDIPLGSIGYYIKGQEPFRDMSERDRSAFITYLQNEGRLNSITSDTDENYPLKKADKEKKLIQSAEETSVFSPEGFSMKEKSGNFELAYNGVYSEDTALQDYFARKESDVYSVSSSGNFAPAFMASEGDGAYYVALKKESKGPYRAEKMGEAELGADAGEGEFVGFAVYSEA